MRYLVYCVAFFVCFFYFIFGTSALTRVNIEQSYNAFLHTISKKYSEDEQTKLLRRLSKSIAEYQDNSKYSNKQEVLSVLEGLNNEEIFQRFIDSETSLSKQKQKEEALAGISQLRKIPYSELASEFKGILTNNWKITQETGYFYAHKFTNYLRFDDAYGIYRKSLVSYEIIPSKSFIFKADEGTDITFVKDYTSSKLVSVDAIKSIANKQQVLSALSKDAKYQTPDMTQSFSKIEFITKILTKNKNDEQKVQAIYAWILDNVSYSQVIDFENQQIFSGIETFSQKSGVCTGYTRLFLYMLSLVGINDVEVIEGHVIDAQDFPQIGHAWVRIGDKYYDPTFDDPIGAKTTKKASEYKYFGLPKDIFYANRYEYDNLPVTLKLASKSEITKHIHDRLARLVPKYKNSLSNYPVFQPIIFREKYNISPLTKLTPNILSQKIGSHTVENDSFRYRDSQGNTKRITAIEYFVLTPENTGQILKQLNYDESKLNLFHWQKSGGSWEWRVIYNLQQK